MQVKEFVRTRKIMAIGKSTAEAYQLQVSAMRGDNFTKYKITPFMDIN
jgi:hypothetical protein